MCYDAEPIEAFSQKQCKARRDHKCCECGRPIRRGDVYENVTGFDDDGPLSFKTCEACQRLREYVEAEEFEECGEGVVPYGILIEAAHEHAQALPGAAQREWSE